MFFTIFFFYLTVSLHADDGLLLFDKEGKILSMNESLMDMYDLDVDQIAMKKFCPNPLTLSTHPRYLLRGYPVSDVFNQPEIQDLIFDILNRREKNKIRIILHGKLTEIISSYKGIGNSLFVGSLIFRDVDPESIQRDVEKNARIAQKKRHKEPLEYYHDLAVGPDRQIVYVKGKRIRTSGIEFRLIHYLMKRTEEIVFNSEILDAINVKSSKKEKHQLDLFLSRVKKKLGKAGDYIRIIPKVGVFFDVKNSLEKQKSTLVVFNDLVIDVQTRQVLEAGKKRILTSEEFDTLLLMVQMEGYTLTPLQISQAIQQKQPNIMSIHRIISSLRVKLPKTRLLIQTVSGEGYCLKSNQSPCKTAVGYEDIFINSHTRKVFRKGLMIPTRHTEFEILLLFMKNSEENFTIPEIHRHIYDARHTLSEKDILINIFSLKEKLRFEGMDYIQTIPQKGYGLQKEVMSKSKGIIVLDSVVFDPYHFIIYIEEEKLDMAEFHVEFEILYRLGENSDEFVPYSRLIDDLQEDNLTERNINQQIYNTIGKFPILDNHVQIIQRKGLRWRTNFQKEPISIDKISINPSSRTVSIEDITMKLPNELFDFIHFIAKDPGVTYTRMQILDALYGKGHGLIEEAINSYFNKIRKKYPKLAEYIQRSTHSRGYCFKNQETQNVIHLPNLKIDSNLLEITRNNKKIGTTYMEIQLLSLLAEAKKDHRGVSIPQIIKTLYNSTDIVHFDSIKKLVSSLNKKIQDEYIIVYQRKGYHLLDVYSEMPTNEDVITLQNLTIDPNSKKVFINEEEKSFIPIEFDILYLLAQSPGESFTTHQIMDYVYGRQDMNSYVINMHIFNIRKKLKDAICFIQTILQGNRSKGKHITRYILLNREIYMEGNMTIDPNRMTIEANGNMEKLTIREFNILEFLLQNSELPISSSRIIVEVFKKKIDEKIQWYPYMLTLRSKLRKLGFQDCIETIPNEGYLLNKSCLWQ